MFQPDMRAQQERKHGVHSDVGGRYVEIAKAREHSRYDEDLREISRRDT
jgi:hypothetical protein